MPLSISFKKVAGHIELPASKSMMQRVCAAALLHSGRTTILNYGSSNDDKAALNIIQQLGAIVSYQGLKLTIESKGQILDTPFINCNESGLSARLFTPIAALSKKHLIINGTGSLLKRPLFLFEKILPDLGVQLFDFNGYLPFTIQGPLKAKNILVDGSLSSQFISGLLFAFTTCAKEKATISVTDLTSKPYIDLSLEVLAKFGKPIVNNDYKFFDIDPSIFEEKNDIEVSIESDWSSAAFWIAAATISGAVSLSGLQQDSQQADKKILDVVQIIGANICWDNDLLIIRSNHLNAFEFDANDSPDLFPVLAVLAACCNGESSIKGVHRLIHKESNRSESIAYLLAKIGVLFRIEDNTLYIIGQKKFRSATINSHNDHRIVMAAALASMHCDSTIKIEDYHAVDKSYPEFINDLRRAGANIY
jgi:3-phosphoshikimate 1-carboxyvinyltransferase